MPDALDEAWDALDAAWDAPAAPPPGQRIPDRERNLARAQFLARAPDDIAAAREEARRYLEPTAGEQATAFGQGLGDVLSMGLAGKVRGQANALWNLADVPRRAGNALLDLGTPAPPGIVDGEGPIDAYRRGVSAQAAKSEAAQEAVPGSYGGGQATGYGIEALLTASALLPAGKNPLLTGPEKAADTARKAREFSTTTHTGNPARQAAARFIRDKLPSEKVADSGLTAQATRRGGQWIADLVEGPTRSLAARPPLNPSSVAGYAAEGADDVVRALTPQGPVVGPARSAAELAADEAALAGRPTWVDDLVPPAQPAAAPTPAVVGQPPPGLTPAMAREAEMRMAEFGMRPSSAMRSVVATQNNTNTARLGAAVKAAPPEARRQMLAAIDAQMGMKVAKAAAKIAGVPYP